MLLVRPKNWKDFQHYKDRAPPWIKLHKGLLDDYEFQSLPIASRALAPMLWLLASEDADGVIDADAKKLGFRLRMAPAEVREALKPLIDAGFFILVGGDSEALAEVERAAIPETERETETETQVEAEADSCAEPQAAPAPEAPPIEMLPTNREGEEVGVSQAQVDEFARLYPAVDVPQELRAMRGWLLTNERKRKTRKGMGAFINSWLSKEQNRAGQTRTTGNGRGATRFDNSVAGARRFLGADEGNPGQNPASDPQRAGSSGQHRAIPPPAAVASDHARGFGSATAQAGRDFPRIDHNARPNDPEIPSFLRRS